MGDDDYYLKPQKRVRPETELDLTLMTTDSVWGKSEVPQELITKLNRLYHSTDESGAEKNIIESLWGLLGFYTRDIRLANLDKWLELPHVRYHLDLAGDLLNAGYVEPFLVALARAVTVLETSQSKGGFLRKRQGTFTHEQFHREEEPPKKSLFGMGKKKEGYQ